MSRKGENENSTPKMTKNTNPKNTKKVTSGIKSADSKKLKTQEAPTKVEKDTSSSSDVTDNYKQPKEEGRPAVQSVHPNSDIDIAINSINSVPYDSQEEQEAVHEVKLKEQKPTMKSGSSTGFWIIFGVVGGGMLLGTGVYIFMLRSKRSLTTTTTVHFR